ncbi:MAG: JAB domain-containing protein [Vulcanimicrobiota bacterium]
MIVSQRKKQIGMPGDIVPVLQSILAAEHETDRDKEHFWVIGLNGANVIQYIELVSLGLINRTLVHPREVFRFAISKAVCSIIVAHNHPSGDPTPSADDLACTRQLVDAGQVVGIRVLDHVIMTVEGHYFSMMEKGVLH